jgi:hypothetical protein
MEPGIGIMSTDLPEIWSTKLVSLTGQDVETFGLGVFGNYVDRPATLIGLSWSI